MNLLKRAIPVLMLAALAAPASATGWDASGFLALELRWFADDPALAGQLDGEQASLVLAPEWRWRSEERRHQLKLAPYARWDAEDDERGHVDLREAYYRHVADDWELLVGVNRVFWGVTESRHLVDVVNQRDAVEDIDEEDKLGQPMVQFAVDRGWGRLEAYALLGFRERTFPGPDGRLRPPLPVDTDAPLYESSAEDGRIDLALRWAGNFGDWDLGAHLFHGTGREPSLVPAAGGVLRPLYRVTEQAGVDVQYTRGAWLWKLEALVRGGEGSTFAAAVGGFEYTLYQLGGTSADLGLLLEVLYDGRDAAPPTALEDDTFLGARLAFNDVQDSQLLAGFIVDHDDRSTAAFVEASRRLGSRWSLELESRLFLDVDPAGELATFAEDGFVTLRVAWNF